jgi:hypothetical protein
LQRGPRLARTLDLKPSEFLEEILYQNMCRNKRL